MKKVLLDYTSMAGGEPSELTASQIIESWKETLPGFDATHHQLGNYISELRRTLQTSFAMELQRIILKIIVKTTYGQL